MSKNVITIEVDGIVYEGWKSATVTKSIETLCGVFSFNGTGEEGVPFPIKRDSKCVIYINDEAVINGWVEKIEVELSNGDHDITVSGRDRTNDVVDSQLDKMPDFKPPISLKKIVEAVLSALNLSDIKVEDPYELSKFKDVETNDLGKTAFNFLQIFAKKRQVLLTTNGVGDITFQRANTEKLKTVLSTRPNTAPTILNSNVTYDNTKRFHKYGVSGQKSLSDPFAESTTPAKISLVGAFVLDFEIRNSREFFFQPDDNGDEGENSDRAKWEANYRTSQSDIYTCTVQGFSPANDDGVWPLNMLVHVIDDFADMNADRLISSVTFSQDLDKGSTTQLKLLTKDSFTKIFVKPKKHKQDNNEGKHLFGG